MNKPIIATLSILALATAAIAQNAPPGGGQPPTPEERFKTADTNADGKLSMAEFAALPMRGRGGADGAPAPTPEDRFATMDTNKDGSVSLDEFKAGMPNRGGQRGG